MCECVTNAKFGKNPISIGHFSCRKRRALYKTPRLSPIRPEKKYERCRATALEGIRISHGNEKFIIQTKKCSIDDYWIAILLTRRYQMLNKNAFDAVRLPFQLNGISRRWLGWATMLRCGSCLLRFVSPMVKLPVVQIRKRPAVCACVYVHCLTMMMYRRKYSIYLFDRLLAPGRCI